MSMHDRSSIRWASRLACWLGIVLVAVISADAQAQGVGSNAKVITWNPAPNGEIFVGILGEIEKPGVYRLDSASLNLQSVIRRSGGFRTEASGTIRIVRQDRVVESIFFSPNANTPLLAGDLLVVESKRAQAAISKMYSADPSLLPMYARAAEVALKGNDPTGIQLAFVNVLDRPVIVKVKHENARLSHVVQMLAQPIELAQAVRVIGPDRLLSQSATPHPVQETIPDGSVLVFPRNAINRGKLPSLPIPYESEIATGAIPSLIGGPSGQSPELRNVGQLPPIIARDGQDLRYAQPPASLEQATIPTPAPAFRPEPSTPNNDRLEIPGPPQIPVVSTPPRIANLPFSGQPRITSSSQMTTELDAAPAAPAPEAIDVPGAPSERVSKPKSKPFRPAIESDDLDEEAPASESATGSPLSSTLMLGMLVAVGLLIGLALLTRRQLERHAANPSKRTPAPQEFSRNRNEVEPEEIAASDEIDGEREISSTPQPEATPIRQPDMALTTQPAPMQMPPSQTSWDSSANPDLLSAWFEQLLANQLPIFDEHPDFPAQVSLQGRIVPPPIFRVDPPASKALVQGPHFPLASQASAGHDEVASQSPPETSQIIDEFDVPHDMGPARPHFMRRRPGEKTIAAAAAARAKSGSPSAPITSTETKPSMTPVTDALRHLQGGQS